MERAVIMAEELREHTLEIAHDEHKPRKTIFGRVKSLFHHEDTTNDDLIQAREAEANYAHDLSDTAALEHANKIPVDYIRRGIVLTKDTEDESLADAEEAAAVDAVKEQTMELKHDDKPKKSLIGKVASAFEHLLEDKIDDSLRQAKETEATYAHDLSDTAAMEHANEIALEDNEQEEEDEDIILKAREAAVIYAHAHDLSDVAAVEHVMSTADYKEPQVFPKKSEEDRIASVEEHYNSIEKDIKAIEHLIEEADKADRAEVREDPNDSLFLLLM